MASSRKRSSRPEFPLWLLALFLLGVLVLWLIASDADYAEIILVVSRGIGTTLWVTIVAFALACLLGLLVAVARTSPVYLLRQAATFYVELIRGIPILVFLFYVAFVGAPWLVTAINVVIAPAVALGWLEPLTIRELDFTWRSVFALTVSIPPHRRDLPRRIRRWTAAGRGGRRWGTATAAASSPPRRCAPSCRRSATTSCR